MTLWNALRIIAADKVKLALAVAAVAVTVSGGMTFGSWTVASSPGSGFAQAVSAVNLTLSTSSTTAQLYPGGTGDLSLTVTNPNPFAVTINSVTGSGTITSDKGAACNASTGVSFTNTSGLSQSVAAGATISFSLAGKVAMSSASDTTCQGATFTVPVTLVATT